MSASAEEVTGIAISATATSALATSVPSKEFDEDFFE
jgi:hypothetical protein